MPDPGDGFVLVAAAAKLAGDGGFGLLEDKFEAGLGMLVKIGAGSIVR